jgi:hypothetical protein
MSKIETTEKAMINLRHWCYDFWYIGTQTNNTFSNKNQKSIDEATKERYENQGHL